MDIIKKKSKIHGYGIFAGKEFKKKELLGNVIEFDYFIFPKIIGDLGNYINHCSILYNADLIYNKELNAYQLVARNNIKKNEEILMDYSQTPYYIQKPKKNYKIC